MRDVARMVAVGWVMGCGPAAGGDASSTTTEAATGSAQTGTTETGAAPATGSGADDTTPTSDGGGTSTSSPDSADGATSLPDPGDSGPLPTGGSSSRCIGDAFELTDVSIVFDTNRVFGEDLVTAFDPDADWACVEQQGGLTRITAQIGPPMFGEPGTQLRLDLYDGARTYDLAVDPAPPGSGRPGLVELSYVVPFEPAAVASYSTINQAATGTVEVTALPVDGEVDVAFHAVGMIAAPDGWDFDVHFDAVVAPQ